MKNYYGFLEEYEKLDNQGYFMTFDLISTNDMEKILSTIDNFWTGEKVEDIQTFHLEISFKKKEIERFEDLSNRRPQASQWYQISLEESGENSAFLYTSLTNNENIEMFIKEINFLDGRSGIGKEISEAISFKNFEDSNEDDLRDILNIIKEPSLIKIYNVGQGGCNSLCDSNERPLVYFDFGKGIGQNLFTLPEAHKFCFKHNPPIILSHWHKDHWSTSEEDSDSLDSAWIVPKQRLGATHLKLATRLNDKGNLYIWPEEVSSMTFNGGWIEKNTGRSINDSGLTLFSIIESSIRHYATLLPGDSKYRYIPSIYNIRLNGLVATHHGGKYQYDINPPFAACDNHIAYSYGYQNSYNHPTAFSINKHQRTGWNRKSDTIRGSIILGP